MIVILNASVQRRLLIALILEIRDVASRPDCLLWREAIGLSSVEGETW